METLTRQNHNAGSGNPDLIPEIAEHDDGELDFYETLDFLGSDYIDEAAEPGVSELVIEARRGSVEAMGELSNYVGQEIQAHLSAETPDTDLVAKLDQAKIALDAHIATVEQQAQLAAANLSVEEESRGYVAQAARAAVFEAYPPDPNSEPTLETTEHNDDGNNDDPYQSPEQDAANDRSRFYDALFDVASLFGVRDPSSMVKVGFDDLLPEQREALYGVFDNALREYESGGSDAQTLYGRTQQDIDRILAGSTSGVPMN